VSSLGDRCISRSGVWTGLGDRRVSSLGDRRISGSGIWTGLGDRRGLGG
jgi:hypothetical protein